MINLHDESLYLQGARQMLLLLKDRFKIMAKDSLKDHEVYARAEVDFILSSMDNAREWLYSYGSTGYYYNFKKDKKGKLLSCSFSVRPPKDLIDVKDKKI